MRVTTFPSLPWHLAYLAETNGQVSKLVHQIGHVFNLGHGIERTTDPDQVARLVDYVHERTEE